MSARLQMRIQGRRSGMGSLGRASLSALVAILAIFIHSVRISDHFPPVGGGHPFGHFVGSVIIFVLIVVHPVLGHRHRRFSTRLELLDARFELVDVI